MQLCRHPADLVATDAVICSREQVPAWEPVSYVRMHVARNVYKYKFDHILIKHNAIAGTRTTSIDCIRNYKLDNFFIRCIICVTFLLHGELHRYIIA